MQTDIWWCSSVVVDSLNNLPLSRVRCPANEAINTDNSLWVASLTVAAMAGLLIHGGRQMLTLSRYPGESIVINNDITVMVASIHNGKVRLAIDAHPSIPVHRKEIHDAIHSNTTRADKITNSASTSTGAADCLLAQRIATEQATAFFTRAGSGDQR